MPKKKKLTPEERAARVAARKAAAAATAVEIRAASPPDGGSTALVEFIPREVVAWPDLTAAGLPKNTMTNGKASIAKLGAVCRLNVFTGRYTVNGRDIDGGFNGELSDAITRTMRDFARMRYGLDVGKEHMSEALLRVCEQNRFHPIEDYLNGLPVWDGVKRLDTWLTKYVGVEDTPLVRAQGRIVIMSAVRRIFEPGCKADHVLVLEGREGVYKSSVVKVLANGSRTGNAYFSDSPILHPSGDAERKQQELTEGVWFYEIAELAGMRKGDQFAIKNFITKQEDRARAAYGRFNKSQPRVCVFIGTFNTTAGGELIQYLNSGDQRRWWPVLVGKIDIPGLEADRDQLFAEAMLDYMVGESCDLYLPPELEAQAKAIAMSREKLDALTDTLSTVAADVARMATVIIEGVRRHQSDKGVQLYKGDEAKPFARVSPDGEIWVASKHVGELVPANRRNDGAAVSNAMRSHGWIGPDKDYRSGLGEQLRGYYMPVPDPWG